MAKSNNIVKIVNMKVRESKITLEDGTTIEMREPKVRDMLAVKDITSDIDREVALFVNLTETPLKILEDLPWAKYQELQMIYQGFGYTKPKK